MASRRRGESREDLRLLHSHGTFNVDPSRGKILRGVAFQLSCTQMHVIVYGSDGVSAGRIFCTAVLQMWASLCNTYSKLNVCLSHAGVHSSREPPIRTPRLSEVRVRVGVGGSCVCAAELQSRRNETKTDKKPPRPRRARRFPSLIGFRNCT